MNTIGKLIAGAIVAAAGIGGGTSMARASGSDREAEIKVWVPRSGDVAGVGNKAFFVDMSIRYKHSDLLGAGFTSPQLTGPGAHQNLPPFPKPATIGHDESIPNLVVLLDGTIVGARQGQNLAGLFELTGVTNREDDEVELWDTWIVGAPNFGTGTSTLRVAVVDDLNHNGILDDAPDTVADSDHDGDVDSADLQALGLASGVRQVEFTINPNP
jgi:hypothetical protein